MKINSNLRDTLKQEYRVVLDNLMAEFGVTDIFQYNIYEDETDAVCYPFAGVYIEVVLSDEMVQSLRDDELRLEELRKELQEIVGHYLERTSNPPVLWCGSVICRVDYSVLFVGDKKKSESMGAADNPFKAYINSIPRENKQ